MYRILVPLDGSRFGEQALATAKALANGANVELELMHAVDFVHNVEEPAAGDETWLHGGARSDADHYLETLATQAHPGCAVSTAVVEGDPAEKIQEEARRWKADLIVMSTHGFGTLDRAWLGSVADAVVRDSHAPVVLVRAHEESGTAEARTFRHLLIPLDGSPLAEQAIEPALNLARRSGARITLLRVVHLAPLMAEGFGSPVQPPVPLDSTLELRRQQASDYLARLARTIDSGLGKIDSQVIVAESSDASEILEFARKHSVDLIALVTHGRSGLKRLVLGSVADKVIRGADVPVLVIRPRA